MIDKTIDAYLDSNDDNNHYEGYTSVDEAFFQRLRVVCVDDLFLEGEYRGHNQQCEKKSLKENTKRVAMPRHDSIFLVLLTKTYKHYNQLYCSKKYGAKLTRTSFIKMNIMRGMATIG